MSDGYSVAVVGATGLVGAEMLDILAAREFPVAELTVFASSRSAGKAIAWGRGFHNVRVLEDGCFDGVDIVFMEVESPISTEWAPRAVKSGAVVIDNSSAWRMDDDVPLVVAEVNPHALDGHEGIVANPNCTTMGLMPVVKPLDIAAGLERMVISTYQAVSGSGRAGIEALDAELDARRGRIDGLRHAATAPEVDLEPSGDTYPRPIGFNVIPECGDFAKDDSDETKEERKLVNESRKILERPDLRVAATCVRVPVVAGHALSVNAEFADEMTAERAVEILSKAPGVELHALRKDFPTPIEVAGGDPTHVGRIRNDESQSNTIDFFVVSDNLRKGAALNCVQIGEALVERDLVLAK